MEEQTSVANKNVYKYLEGSEEQVKLEDTLEEIDLNEVKPSELSIFTVWIYAIGELGVSVGNVLYGLFYTTFLLEVTRVFASHAGSVLLIGQIWDAITTPIIGYLTDNTKTRWGRRRPWLLFSAIPFGLSYMALWQAWPDESSNEKFAYSIMTVLIYNLAGNCIQIPYSALTSDLVQSYYDTTVLTRARMLVDMAGGVVNSFSMSAMITYYRYPNGKINYAKGFSNYAFIWGSISIIPPIVNFLFLREKQQKENVFEIRVEQTPKLKRIWRELKKVLSTVLFKPYLILTLMYLLSWTTIQFSQTNMYLFYKYVLQKEQHFQWIIFLIQAVACLSIFMWSLLCKYMNKNHVFALGMGIIAITGIPNYWMNEKWPSWIVYMLAVPAGVGLSTAFLIPWSMVPDIINADEYENYSRREGVFYSLFVLIQKVGIALALSLHSYGLGWAGFQSSGDQPELVVKVIRIMGSWIGFSVLTVSVFVSLFYPLGKKEMNNIMSELDKRNTQK